ncbi:hypothetical protein [Subtercola sp. YIM 133946]|uniref:hypothetical protein n=1 Tax=Subtercola sp. YIM 133946 TaxID=3118909 RepID=UPI002F95BD9D
MATNPRAPYRAGKHAHWRNLLVVEAIGAIVVLAILATDYSPAVWIAVAVIVVTAPIVIRGWLRSRG